MNAYNVIFQPNTIRVTKNSLGHHVKDRIKQKDGPIEKAQIIVDFTDNCPSKQLHHD